MMGLVGKFIISDQSLFIYNCLKKGNEVSGVKNKLFHNTNAVCVASIVQRAAQTLVH